MIVDALSVDSELRADLAIVGAGPAGIVTALEVADAGFDVVLVESGRAALRPSRPGAGRRGGPSTGDLHAPMSMATRRQIGGASAIWGGRCVPYDPVDFDRRPWITDHEWPVAYEELVPYFQRACDWFVCGEAVFDATETKSLPPSIVPGLPNGEAAILRARAVVAADRLRPPVPRPPTRRHAGPARHRRDVHADRPTARRSGRRPASSAGRSSGRELTSAARRYVIAGGGLESTRLLLASPGRDGRPDRRPLGSSRSLVHGPRGGRRRERPTSPPPPRETIHGYERDADGVYVRRRFSFSRELQHAEALPNVTGWLVHPELADPRHRSGALSFAYLALASPAGRVRSRRRRCDSR